MEFFSSAMARSAAMALNGRKFGEKTVIVQYVSPYITISLVLVFAVAEVVIIVKITIQ